MWLKFTADMDFSPRYGVTIAYKNGMVLNVPRAAADAAVASGKGVVMRKSKKDEVPRNASSNDNS